MSVVWRCSGTARRWIIDPEISFIVRHSIQDFRALNSWMGEILDLRFGQIYHQMLDDDCREQSFNSIMVLSFPKFFPRNSS
jgi:hypothetical protein